MEMKYSLTGSLSVVLYQIKSVCSQRSLHLASHFLCHQNCLLCSLIIQFKQICKMILRQQKRMSSCSRTQIQDHTKFLILIKCGGRNLTIGDLTKNTITVFHFLTSFLFFLKKFYNFFSI